MVVVLLGLIEVGLRIRYRESFAKHEDRRYLFIPSPNPALIYEMRASHDAVYPGTDIEVHTNAAGFRDREFTSKPQGRFRIVVVGDSVTVGWEVASELTYPKQLERLLAQRGGADVDVFNMGVGGYNSLQEVELIRSKALAYDPDLIILGFVLNDSVLWGHDGGATRYFLHSGSMLWDLLRFRVARMRYWFGDDLVTEAFRKLADLVGERKVPVLVVVFPYLEEDDSGGYPYQETHDQVAALSKRHGFDLLDLLEPFRRAGLATLRSRTGDIIHPDAQGHRIAAEAIFAHLR